MKVRSFSEMMHPLAELKGRPAELAVQLNQLHDQFMATMRTSIELAKKMGAVLDQVKNELKHGQYEDWVTLHFDGSLESARVYKRVHCEWHRIEPKLRLGHIKTLEDAREVLRAETKPGEKKLPELDLNRRTLEQTFAIHVRAWPADLVKWLRDPSEHGINRLDGCLNQLKAEWERSR